MNKKLLNLMAIALLFSVQMQAQSVFQYTATAKVEAFDKVENLTGAEAVVSHEFDADTGQGTVMYEGDVTKIVPSAFWHTEALTTITIPEGVQKGQRVDKTYKGVVIRNGKTIINNY